MRDDASRPEELHERRLARVGGILLAAIGLRILNIKVIAIGNLLPAIFLAPIIATAAHQFI
jgi:uncharacterized membrane protein YqgA involved in biofilm formation